MDEKTKEMAELFKDADAIFHPIPIIGCEYTAIFKDNVHAYQEYVGVCIKHTPNFCTAASIESAEFVVPAALAVVLLTKPVWKDKYETKVVIPQTYYALTEDGVPLRYLGMLYGTHYVFLKDASPTIRVLLRNPTIDVMGFLCSGSAFKSEYNQ